MSPKRCQIIFSILMGIAIVGVLLMSSRPFVIFPVLFWITAVIVFLLITIAVILLFVYWRCIKCKKALPRLTLGSEFCPFCGEHLG